MKLILTLLTALLLVPPAALQAADSPSPAHQYDDGAWLREKGTLIFADYFDRKLDGNGIKAIGNGWESATADRAPNVKQADLDGGILKYLEACGGAHYNGTCYVFDERTTLDADLKPGADRAESQVATE